MWTTLHREFHLTELACDLLEHSQAEVMMLGRLAQRDRCSGVWPFNLWNKDSLDHANLKYLHWELYMDLQDDIPLLSHKMYNLYYICDIPSLNHKKSIILQQYTKVKQLPKLKLIHTRMLQSFFTISIPRIYCYNVHPRSGLADSFAASPSKLVSDSSWRNGNLKGWHISACQTIHRIRHSFGHESENSNFLD